MVSSATDSKQSHSFSMSNYSVVCDDVIICSYYFFFCFCFCCCFSFFGSHACIFFDFVRVEFISRKSVHLLFFNFMFVAI